MLPIFIFDTEILSKLKSTSDARITFIFDCLSNIYKELKQQGSALFVYHGKPVEKFKRLLSEEKLLDYELASNNGRWQWAAGCDTDAQPYFRIFNPYEQTRKFDPQQRYIKKWIPEINSKNYPDPIIDHKFARQRAIDIFKNILR